jgi:ATP-binding cassette subfamily F protein 3
MINLEQVFVEYGERRLFDAISFQVIAKDRIGLVGKNGAGKSTLLKVMAGLVKPDQGGVHKAKETTLGYLPQDMHHNEDNPIFKEALSAFDVILGLQEQATFLENELSTRTDYESESYHKCMEDLADIHDKLGLLDAYTLEEKVEKVLIGLGFEPSEFDKPMKAFSGGWKMRVELAKILLSQPDILLLDEPTNHLDIESISWLESFLKPYKGGVVLISHDKLFLDNVCNRTMEINAGKVYDYKFAYSKYLLVRAEEMERQKSMLAQQEKEIQKTQELIDKFRAKASKASFAQSLIKKLDRMERVEVDETDDVRMHLKFQVAQASGKVVLEANDIAKHFEEKQVLKGIDLMVPRGEKIAIVGKNGQGKSTLLKILVGELEADKGKMEWGYNVKVGYFAQNQAEKLEADKTVFDTIDEVAEGDVRKQIRSLLGAFLFQGDDVFKKVKVLSGGERGRLALCKLLLEPYNVLVLDEPTNHLDIRSKNVLKEALRAYQGTLLLVSHDRDFLDGLTTQIFEINKGLLKVHHGDIMQFLKDKQAETLQEFSGKKEQIALDKANQKKTDKPVENKDKKVEDKKNIEKITQKIIQVEEKIKNFEHTKLASLDYQDAQKSKEVLQVYEGLKQELKDLYSQWEQSND